MTKKEYDINIRKYTSHQNKFPWQLIIKIIIACVLIAGLYYASIYVTGKSIKENQDGVEVEIETPS